MLNTNINADNVMDKPMSNYKQSSEEQTQGYICPVTKVQCDDECCVSAEDCHIKSWDRIGLRIDKETDLEKNIESLWEELFRDDWMDDSDWSELKIELEKETGLSFKELASQLRAGVENGHSIETQFELIKSKINEQR